MSYIIGSIAWLLAGFCIGFVASIFLLGAVFAAEKHGLIDGDLYLEMVKAGERILSKF